MKIPRDLSGVELIKLLGKNGYTTNKQKGSHIKIITQENGEHHLAIPNHSPAMNIQTTPFAFTVFQ